MRGATLRGSGRWDYYPYAPREREPHWRWWALLVVVVAIVVVVIVTL